MKTSQTLAYHHTLTAKEITDFQNFILRFYQRHGRHELPWRQTDNPYYILVSELMLQQTQVNRVIPKYESFITHFPTVNQLAESNLSQVLTLWQGLGYNRRAKFLWQLAAVLTKNTLKTTQIEFPRTQEELIQLPGIGPYTASAIVTFAYNQPTMVLETNIRTVFLHHFFPNTSDIPDSAVKTLITETLYQTNPREWYWALMDYGSYLKKTIPNPSRKSKHHTKQSTFKGSLRQVRGEIIKLLILQEKNHATQSDKLGLSKQELQQKITGNKIHLDEALQQLIAENLIIEKLALETVMNQNLDLEKQKTQDLYAQNSTQYVLP